VRDLLTRLKEVQIGDFSADLPDSAGLAGLVAAYQKKKGMKSDGKISADLVTRMNGFDTEKYRRLAITLDRYKQLPDSFPGKYILVNLPEYKLYVREYDSLLLESRIICGKPITPTPILTSGISELVVFPTWTVPESIIKKEILPALKRNSGYLSRKGMYLLDKNGKRVKADTVNWARFSKGIPYKVQQGSGEDNALGVLKFNFASPHMIYLHDTDGRHLFKNGRRAMSHGCVRVQEWEKLAALVIENDSAKRQPADSLVGFKDSITNWISRKERHIIKIKNHFPLYIRYLGCGVQEGKLVFFEDIYKLDKELRDQYFSEKKILPYL
jgi:murein L,D-transpeptidase YcbB/YkuD